MELNTQGNKISIVLGGGGGGGGVHALSKSRLHPFYTLSIHFIIFKLNFTKKGMPAPRRVMP